MRNIEFQNIELTQKLFGYHNTHLGKISAAFNLTINSSEQMKMFLTWLGYGSKAIVTDDVTQIDLPTGKKCGLVEAKKILTRIKGIDFITFTKENVA